ncbi:MAG: phosphotransferase [Nostoc sp. DedQUE12b]|uniref:phosphotransferase n=1 Tax=Nostoc sp. DedQUE12b TaxID=3075398 RepID=UPI002AD4BC74|nr:phosphotransferase [Nostoc sp. DedQUE12b]MDZ8089150.1 phosphotransferase [Nostoc sp. DedQUE12b]
MSSENSNRTALTARAVAAAVSVVSAHGVKVDAPHVLNNAYSVRVYLHPAPIVARVSTVTALLRSPIESWLAREISVAEFLASCGSPVIAPSDRLPAIPHQHDGLFMTFWRYVQPVSDRLPDPQIIGRMLAELHALLHDYPGDLPLLAPPQNDIPRGLERLKQAGDILTTSDLTLLQEIYDRLLPQLATDQLQPLHGDANALNLIPTAEGWLWNDFEDTCRGHIAWDLINLDDEGRSAYPNAPDSSVLEPYIKMRQLHAIVWVYALLPEFPDWAEYAKVMLNNLRDHKHYLNE